MSSPGQGGLTKTVIGLAMLAACGLAVYVAFAQRSAGPAASSPAGGAAVSVDELKAAMAKLRPLYQKLGKPQPGDWLTAHREPGQTFQEYLKSDPVTLGERRRVIYIQPLGDFTDKQRKILDLTADFMGRFFNTAVKMNETLPMTVIPSKARRTHPTWGDKQILSTSVLDEVLRSRLPKDAFAMIAFTAGDLWPGEGWNFVFGQASLRDRVGVWSMYRFGDPGQSDQALRLCLLRTMKTAVHETGHMLSIQHCTAYECGMCGSNSLPEADRRPLAFCPECMAKVCWAASAPPAERFRKLAAFCRDNGLKDQAAFYEKCLAALSPAPAPSTQARKEPEK